MGKNWVEPTAFSALLVALTSERDDSTTRLLALAAGLRAHGHLVRVVTADDAASEAFRARDIPCWQARHEAEHQPSRGELASYARAIFHALSAEPTHIIHAASLRATYAAALASFAFTLRHPCAPEPAIVTALDERDGRAQTRRFLPGDYFIASSARARDAFVSSGGHQSLSDRTHIIAPGSDHGVAATVAVYHLAWERRQRENRQALLAFEA
jgi:hypothetical protein